MNYNVVSSDDHVQETDNTWAQRVPAALRDRVPRLRRARTATSGSSTAKPRADFR